MKRYYAAAGALLLGTSALAWAGDMKTVAVEPTDAATTAKTDLSWDKAATDKTMVASKSDLATAGDSFGKTIAASKSDLSTTGDANLEMASLDKDLEKSGFAGTDEKIHTASFDAKNGMGWSDSDAKLQTADMTGPKPEWSDSGKVETAAWSDTKIQTADKIETGMGGPLEEVTTATVEPSNAAPERDARGIAVISDPAFVPPGYNGTSGAVGGPDSGEESYPACTAAVTDNCVQLYERGVHDSLASAKSGTLDASDSQAMGGPFEPVDSSDLAMNGDGQVDTAFGETSDLGVQSTAATEATVADHSDYQGVGGPIEAQSGYPPCSPGPGDDRCIQLYEHGVTGAGN